MRKHGRELKRRYGHVRLAKSPKYVVRKGGMKELYLQPDGSWGSYKTSKRFASQDKAGAAYERLYAGHDYGVFPTSVRQ